MLDLDDSSSYLLKNKSHIEAFMKKIIIGLTLFLIIIVLGAGFFISGEVINLKSKDYLTTYNMEIKYKRFTEKYFKSLPKEDITIKSPYGYSMYALYIPYKNSKKTIIITHGRTYTHLGSIKYAKMFRSWGFNVLTPDSRYHGKTGGANATYGFYERYDMKAWVDWVQKKTGKKTKIGFHAESMSTAICILHGAIDNRASYYILDGSYTSLKEMLAYMLKKQYKLPSFPFLNIASGISKLKGAMYYDDLRLLMKSIRSRCQFFSSTEERTTIFQIQ